VCDDRRDGRPDNQNPPTMSVRQRQGVMFQTEGAAAVESIVQADVTDAQRARGPGVRLAPSVVGLRRLDPVYGSTPALRNR
jgi:hypothetical protein